MGAEVVPDGLEEVAVQKAEFLSLLSVFGAPYYFELGLIRQVLAAVPYQDEHPYLPWRPGAAHRAAMTDNVFGCKVHFKFETVEMEELLSQAIPRVISVDDCSELVHKIAQARWRHVVEKCTVTEDFDPTAWRRGQRFSLAFDVHRQAVVVQKYLVRLKAKKDRS